MMATRLTHTNLFAFLLTTIVSLISCNDMGTLSETVQIPPSDCGTCGWFFVPTDTAGDFYYITGARVYPTDELVQNGISNVFFCRTLHQKLIFTIDTEYKRLNKNQLSAYPGIKTDPIIGEIVNPIKWTNASMRFDRDIQFRGQVIPAGTNVLDRVTIQFPSFDFPLTISPFAIMEIHMSTDDFKLPNGEYHLTTSWETLDNKTISATVDFIVLM